MVEHRLPGTHVRVAHPPSALALGTVCGGEGEGDEGDRARKAEASEESRHETRDQNGAKERCERAGERSGMREEE